MAEGSISRAELVSRLGATVGAAKAQSAVDEAARTLGIDASELSLDVCARLLDHLAASSDIVGIAARLLKVQVTLRAPTRDTPAPGTKG